MTSQMGAGGWWEQAIKNLLNYIDGNEKEYKELLTRSFEYIPRRTYQSEIGENEETGEDERVGNREHGLPTWTDLQLATPLFGQSSPIWIFPLAFAFSSFCLLRHLLLAIQEMWLLY